MDQIQVLHRFFYKFFPKKYSEAPTLLKEYKDWEKLEENKKNDLAKEFLIRGESRLLNGDLHALQLFESASMLAPSNPEIWYRQGIAFYEYGSQDGKEKALLVSSKNFKMATNLNHNMIDAWRAWGNVLYELGKFHHDHHYFLEAKEKYQKAIALCQECPQPELYWDYALVWTAIAEHSGEAVDVRMALEAFRNAENYQTTPSSDFYNDFGCAYLQMGLLVNDSRLIEQGVKQFKKSLDIYSDSCETWSHLAHAYTELYINTMDEGFFSKAHEAYGKVVNFDPKDVEIWLNWAQLLGESGKLNQDAKKLHLSVDKCVKANSLLSDDPQIVGQWVESLSLLAVATNRLDLLVEAEDKIIEMTHHQSDYPDLWYAYGMVMYCFGKYYQDIEYYELANEKLQQGISLDRNHAELWHALAMSHAQIGKIDEDFETLERACRFFTRACELKPACPSLTYDYARCLLKLAEMTEEQKWISKSIHQFEITLQSQKDALLQHPDWLFYYACALDLLGDFTEEEKHFIRASEILQHVLLIDPDFPEIYFRMAITLSHLAEISYEKETFEKALNYFKLAKNQDEEDGSLWLEWGLAYIHYAQLSYDSASMEDLYYEAEQKILIAGKQGNQHAYYHLACLYSLLGRYSESLNLLKKAQTLEILPTLEELLEDDWLEGLRSTQEFSEFLSLIEEKKNLADEF